MMSTPSPRYPDNRDWPAQSGPMQTSNNILDSDHGPNGAIESTELLRWRADMLLDEMMLGGVDVAAGNHHQNGNGSNGYGNGYENRSPTSPNGSYTNGAAYPTSTVQPYLSQTNSVASANGHTTSAENGYRPDSTRSNGIYTTFNQPVASASTSAQPQPAHIDTTTPVLVSAEQRYANLGRGRSTQATPVSVNNGYTGPLQPGPLQPGPLQPAGNKDFGAGAGPLPSPSVAGESGQYAELGPMRRVDVAGAMAVANRGSKYSTLLPRESASNPDLLQREIVLLREQVSSVMPLGHETRERAQKLLEKAYSILQADSLRSAEVEYYLQQVRAMIERVKQSFTYSTLYRSRLITYLMAWIALASIVITGCLLYGENLVSLLVAISDGSAKSLGFQHLTAMLLTLFTGALGGAVCALWSIQRHAKREYGFFDRKFSLRNLVFPLSGFVVSLFIYLVFGLFYWGLRLDPSQSLWLAMLPMLVVFGLATSQEMLFGLRD